MDVASLALRRSYIRYCYFRSIISSRFTRSLTSAEKRERFRNARNAVSELQHRTLRYLREEAG